MFNNKSLDRLIYNKGFKADSFENEKVGLVG